MKVKALFLALTLCFATANAKKVHKKKHRHRSKEYPVRELPKPDEQKHFTTALPEDTKDGTHSFRQIRSLFFDKNLAYAEIKNLFTQMDINKDNKIDDTEWYQFYDTIIAPFQTCDKDLDFALSVAELKDCLGTSDFSQIKHNIDSDEALTKILHFMDRNKANLIGFLWLRRLNYAWQTCSNGVQLNANRILCALTITSPRTRHLIPSEEKGIFQATIVLSDGYNWGQQSTISVLQYAQVAYIYNYFTDYEIQMSDLVRKDDVLRAIQDGVLPHWFSRLVADEIFFEKPTGVSFPDFAGMFYAQRLFSSQTEILFLNKDQYTALITSNLVPERLKDYIAKSYTATQEEIEASSERVFTKVEEKNYFNTYNNMIFLQKKHKTRLQKISSYKKKSQEVELDEFLGKLEFPADSASIIFNMYDNYRNESIHISDWFRFIRTSFTYMSLTPNGVQRLNYDQVQKRNEYLDGSYNCFAYGVTESKYQTLLYDWLTENQEYAVNMKEYLAWYRLPFGFEYLKQPGLPWRTSVKRTAQAFKDLGFRFSKYNRQMALAGYNLPLGERNYQYLVAFKIALKEDSAAYWYKLNKGAKYVHTDLEAGAADPER